MSARPAVGEVAAARVEERREVLEVAGIGQAACCARRRARPGSPRGTARARSPAIGSAASPAQQCLQRDRARRVLLAGQAQRRERRAQRRRVDRRRRPEQRRAPRGSPRPAGRPASVPASRASRSSAGGLRGRGRRARRATQVVLDPRRGGAARRRAPAAPRAAARAPRRPAPRRLGLAVEQQELDSALPRAGVERRRVERREPPAVACARAPRAGRAPTAPRRPRPAPGRRRAALRRARRRAPAPPRARSQTPPEAAGSPAR